MRVHVDPNLQVRLSIDRALPTFIARDSSLYTQHVWVGDPMDVIFIPVPRFAMVPRLHTAVVVWTNSELQQQVLRPRDA